MENVASASRTSALASRGVETISPARGTPRQKAQKTSVKVTRSEVSHAAYTGATEAATNAAAKAAPRPMPARGASHHVPAAITTSRHVTLKTSRPANPNTRTNGAASAPCTKALPNHNAPSPPRFRKMPSGPPSYQSRNRARSSGANRKSPS